MLSSLWTRLARRYGFWLKLLTVSSVSHLVIFFIFFFVFTGQKSVLSIDINRSILNSGAPIVFMNIGTNVSVGKKSNVKNGARIGKMGSTSSTRRAQKKDAIDKNKEKAKNRIIKKSCSKNNKYNKRNKKLLKKNLKNKNKQKNNKKNKVNKKEKSKKLQNKALKNINKKEFPKKIEPKKEEKKKPEKPIEKEELKKDLNIEPEAVKKVEQEILPQETKELHEIKPIDINIDIQNETISDLKSIENGQISIGVVQDGSVIYIGQNEAEGLRIQYEVQAEVVKHWSPPAGLAKDLSCEINLTVDWEGKASQVKVAKSSGVLVYDISARVAASKLILPSSLRAKELNIVFNQ